MSITSANFFGFLFISLIIYYLVPKRAQWLSLLLFSNVFFYFSSGLKGIIYLLIETFIVFCASLLFKKTSKRKIVFVISLILVITILGRFKYVNSFIRVINVFISTNKIELLNIIAPLGISYYTLSLLSYLVDVYWEKYEPEKNYFKLLLFASYFPLITSGPIIRYDQSQCLFEEHKFVDKKVYFGIWRILYGVMQKLVVADFLGLIVNYIYGNYAQYKGIYILFALVLFIFQLYADFSGCMDIIMGVSECFDIKLPENFVAPLFSKTVSEFWRRWHITMGEWFKDYVLYPLLKSNLVQNSKKYLIKKFSKNFAKKICTYVPLLFMWVLIGIWHGGSLQYIFASGIIPGTFLMFGEVLQPLFEKAIIKFSINKESKLFGMFSIIRTVFCLCCSWVLIPANSFSEGLSIVKHLFANFVNSNLVNLNLINEEYFIDTFKASYLVLLACCLYLGFALLIMYIVDRNKIKGIDFRDKIYKINGYVQILLIIFMLFFIVVFGTYGQEFDASSFIYKNF